MRLCLRHRIHTTPWPSSNSNNGKSPVHRRLMPVVLCLPEFQQYLLSKCPCLATQGYRLAAESLHAIMKKYSKFDNLGSIKFQWQSTAHAMLTILKCGEICALHRLNLTTKANHTKATCKIASLLPVQR